MILVAHPCLQCSSVVVVVVSLFVRDVCQKCQQRKEKASRRNPSCDQDRLRPRPPFFAGVHIFSLSSFARDWRGVSVIRAGILRLFPQVISLLYNYPLFNCWLRSLAVVGRHTIYQSPRSNHYAQGQTKAKISGYCLHIRAISAPMKPAPIFYTQWRVFTLLERPKYIAIPVAGPVKTTANKR